jgi:hypothetical protein
LKERDLLGALGVDGMVKVKVKVKVKLSLYLTWGGGLAPRILDLGTGRR